ncbi:hypothetical protein GJAV_G00143730 [Gymnothorax javanicus]|nr:hypothetical protein GJAV_G00143730 [Gymnothorax javanicus]
MSSEDDFNQTYQESRSSNKTTMEEADSSKEVRFGWLALGRNFQTKYKSYSDIKVDGLRGDRLASQTSLLNVPSSEITTVQNNSNSIEEPTEQSNITSPGKNDSVSEEDSQFELDMESVERDEAIFLSLLRNSTRNNDSSAVKSQMETLNNDTGYQSDATELAGLMGDMPFSTDGSGLPTAYILQAAESKPLVLCGTESMALVANKREYDYLQVDGVSDTPVSLSDLPTSCGHTFKMMSHNLVLKTPYDGCVVIKKGNKYIMPLLWWESPVKISCPATVSQTPHYPPLPPLPFPSLPPSHLSVICSPFGMNLLIEGGLNVASRLQIQVRGKKMPFLASQCGYFLIGSPERPIIHVPYSACGMKVKDGMYALSLFSGKTENIFTCRLSLLSFPPLSDSITPFYGYHGPPVAHQVPPLKAPVYPPVTDSFYLRDHSLYARPPAISPLKPASTPHSHLPTAFSVCTPSGPRPCISPFPFNHHLNSLPPPLPPQPRDPLSPPLHDHHILLPLSPPNDPVSPLHLYHAPTSPPLHHYHGPLSPLAHQIHSRQTPLDSFYPLPPRHPEPPSPPLSPGPYETGSYSFHPHVALSPPVAQLPYDPFSIPQSHLNLLSPLPLTPHHPHAPFPPPHLPDITAPSSGFPSHTLPTLSSPSLSCTSSHMRAILSTAVPGTIRVKGLNNEWQPITSVPGCSFSLEAMGYIGVMVLSTFHPCPAFIFSPSLITLPIRFIDADKGQDRTLELQCPYYSPTAPLPPVHPGPTPHLQVICSDHSMIVELPPGADYALRVQVEGTETGLSGMPRKCDYSITKDKYGRSVLVVPYSSCHISVKGNERKIFVKFRTQSGYEGEVPLSCQITPSRKKQGCEISDDLRLPCGHGLVAPAECRSLGCCYCSITHTCYYPLDECTPDRHMIFIVPATLTSPPLSTTSLFTPGKDTCFPVKVTHTYALFKIPLGGCGVHQYDVGNTKIYMVEILNTLNAISLNYGTITRDSPVRLIVECRYSPSALVSTSYMVKTPSLGPSIHAQGVFGVQLRIAKDETYTDYYPQYHRPFRSLLKEPLYLEVRLLNPPDANVVLLVHYCLAYPRSLDAAWVLNYDGCPNQLDTAGQLPTSAPSPLSQIRRFTIRTFQFLLSDMSYSDEEIYFMCSTEVCAPSEGPCVEGCLLFPSSDT